jgi:uncharacterized membrane protein YgdD (TMEM256/DUF423 family)
LTVPADQHTVFAAAPRRTFIWGAIFMAIAVALGAFGAHGLKSHTDAQGLATWETAVRYQAWHGLALLVLSASWARLSPRFYRWSTICMIAGVFIFSGSLYILVLSGIKWLGAITPIGGLLFIAGWILAALASRSDVAALSAMPPPTV